MHVPGIKRPDCQRRFGKGNKRVFQQIVDAGNRPGILAYHVGQPAGWRSIAPREEFCVLDRSPTLKRLEDQPVWTLACFFISKPYRRRGLTAVLIRSAIPCVGERRAKITEAYRLSTGITKLLPYERFMGIESTFARQGFHVVARRSDRRLLMHYLIEAQP